MPPEGRRPLLAAMADLRASFTRGHNVLTNIAGGSTHADERGYRESLAVTRRELAFLVDQDDLLSPEQRELIALIQDELHAYATGAENVINKRKSPRWNVAQHLLREDASPKARIATQLLTAMTTSQG